MTIEENAQLQERISKVLVQLTTAMNSIPNTMNLFLEQYNSITQSLHSIMAMPAYLQTVANAVSETQQRFISMYSGIDYQGICTAINGFARIQEKIFNSLAGFDAMSYQSILNSLANTLAYVEPYLPPEKKEECERVILPKLSKESRIKLTFSDVVAILSLLVTIYFGIISSLPNDQLDRLIEQNEIIIEQQDEIARLKEEDEKLLNALNSLTDSINLLSEEVELLRNELESSEDIPDGQSLPDTEDSQDEHGDTE